jgi:hypothetical protein
MNQILLIIFMTVCFTGCVYDGEVERNSRPDQLIHNKKQLEAQGNIQIILDGRLKLHIPKSFSRVSEQELMEKFPNVRQRPTEIFQESEKVKFSLSFGSSPARAIDLISIKGAFEATYKASGAHFHYSKFEILNGDSFVVMSFELPNLLANERIVNQMFFTSLDNKLLFGSLSYPRDEQDIWQPIGTRIIGSIKRN